MNLSWKPVRKGAVYCAPACGGGCLHAAYLSACAEARLLVTALGPGWKPRVWENLGWHYSAVMRRGDCSVHAHKHHGKITGYYAILGGHYTAGGQSPKGAVRAAMRAALAALQAAFGSIKEALA